jgi:hypothetical protein
MSLSWWLVGAGAGVIAVLGGLHWTILDLLLDRFGARRAGRRAETSGTAPMLEG